MSPISCFFNVEFRGMLYMSSISHIKQLLPIFIITDPTCFKSYYLLMYNMILF